MDALTFEPFFTTCCAALLPEAWGACGLALPVRWVSAEFVFVLPTPAQVDLRVGLRLGAAGGVCKQPDLCGGFHIEFAIAAPPLARFPPKEGDTCGPHQQQSSCSVNLRRRSGDDAPFEFIYQPPIDQSSVALAPPAIARGLDERTVERTGRAVSRPVLVNLVFVLCCLPSFNLLFSPLPPMSRVNQDIRVVSGSRFGSNGHHTFPAQ